MLVYLGLTLAILLAALDQTIVATALKSIITDLGHQDLVPWVGSGYMLTAAPVGTLYGKFADIFGRKWVFVFAIVVFEIGSFMCGIANTMYLLIAGRAVAGVGGGGIFALVLIIISDIVSLQDRGKYQGVIGAVFGLASVVGPVVGGAFSDKVSWRWCFYINLPLGAITLLTVVIFLNFPPPEGTIREKLDRIDGIGAILLLLAVVCLVTPVQLGGSIWDWNSPQVIALFIVAAVLFVAFAYVEIKVAKEPIVPPSIFVNRSVPALLAIAFCIGAAFLSGVYYISLFFQVVFGDTATQAGLATIPMVFGLVLLTILSGVLISKTGTYRHFFFIGPCIMVPGIILTSFLNQASYLWQQIIYLGIFGIGVGCMIQTRILGIQASVPIPMIAVATAVSQTCNVLGGAIGVSITGTIFNNVIVSATSGDNELNTVLGQLHAHNITVKVSDTLELLGLIKAAPSFIQAPTPALQSVLISTFSNATQQLVDGFTKSFNVAYLCLLPYGVLIVVAGCFVQQFQMRTGKDVPAAE